MIAYLMLTLRYRYEHYESMGALYRSMNAEILNETLEKRLWGLFQELLCVVVELFEIDIDELFKKLFTNKKMESMLLKMLAYRNLDND